MCDTVARSAVEVEESAMEMLRTALRTWFDGVARIGASLRLTV